MRYEQDHCTESDKNGNCVAVGGGHQYAEQRSVCDSIVCEAGYQRVGNRCVAPADVPAAAARSYEQQNSKEDKMYLEAQNEIRKDQRARWKRKIASDEAAGKPTSFIALEKLAEKCAWGLMRPSDCAPPDCVFAGVCGIRKDLKAAMCAKDPECSRCPAGAAGPPLSLP